MSHRERQCSIELELEAKPSRRIVIPCSQSHYQDIVENHRRFRDRLDRVYKKHPELFPTAIAAGYRLHDIQQSKKMPEVPMRRIKLRETGEVYTVAPDFVMPYMTGYTDDVEKGLYLRRFGVPFWGLTYVFGRNDMYWQRLVQRLGHYDVVGTTVKHPTRLPDHLLADEKYTSMNGERRFIAMTVGADCVLGIALALRAIPSELTQAYGEFKREVHRLNPDYQPLTLNFDGWLHTRQSWLTLFPTLVIIRCFVHTFLRIRDRCKRLDCFPDIQRQVWDIYHSLSPETFTEHLMAFLDFAHVHLQGEALKAVLKFKKRQFELMEGLYHPGCHRVSTMLDRHMQSLTRCLYMARDFHGHRTSAHLQVRAWALMHNFWPYCPRTLTRSGSPYTSPAHKLNQFCYHDNWLHNLLIATSCQHIYIHHKFR